MLSTLRVGRSARRFLSSAARQPRRRAAEVAIPLKPRLGLLEEEFEGFVKLWLSRIPRGFGRFYPEGEEETSQNVRLHRWHGSDCLNSCSRKRSEKRRATERRKDGKRRAEVAGMKWSQGAKVRVNYVKQRATSECNMR
eukprot:scaffold193_cov255-Pinguiococcus_pyrenoidosus.AAC.9